NVLMPGMFALEPSARRGPRKSPDYIVTDGAGSFSVLECKGSQTSRASLVDALNRGVRQKQNLRALGATTLEHSLVAGLFIPQFGSNEYPALVVADPEWDDVKRLLAQFKTPAIERGVVQVANAKQAALLELSQTANALARTHGGRETVQ